MNKNGDLVGAEGIAKAQMVSITEPDESMPVSNGDAVPYLIPGKNKGGNRTCEEAQAAFTTIFGGTMKDLTDCSRKVDIGDDYVGFVREFPFEVEVLKDGTIRFDVGERQCEVFAVIVKGSNQANVYYYPEGIESDGGLTPPAFDPEADVLKFPWVSNITFCCACESQETEKVISVKAFHYKEGASGETSYALSVGRNVFPEGWCAKLGLNAYPNPDPDPILLGDVGTITVETNGDVTVALINDMVLDRTYLFVGEEADLDKTDCPDYESWVEWLTDGNSISIPATNF